MLDTAFVWPDSLKRSRYAGFALSLSSAAAATELELGVVGESSRGFLDGGSVAIVSIMKRVREVGTGDAVCPLTGFRGEDEARTKPDRPDHLIHLP